jgi:hypothetical protein
VQQSSGPTAVIDALRRMTSSVGIPPIEAGRAVFDGIRAAQCWISTSERYEEVIRPRCEAILARLPPSAQYRAGGWQCAVS